MAVVLPSLFSSSGAAVQLPPQREFPMSELVSEMTVCPRCHAELDATDSYCRHCGASANSSAGNGKAAALCVEPVASVVRQPGWSESPWLVLPLMFLVLGPFALPLLWRSRRFNLVWKILLTAVMLAVTVYLVWCIWLAVNQALVTLDEADKAYRF
jgi:ribosomal protein L40E